MKNLVTHLQPHLDDIAGIWLFKKYHPNYKDASINFVAGSISGGETFDGNPVDSDPNLVHIGVCRGKFDEHGIKDASIRTSASMLVYEHLVAEDVLTGDDAKAAKLVVDHVLEEDTGMTRNERLAPYTAGSIIYAMRLLEGNREKISHDAVDLGIQMLEALLLLKKQDVIMEHDWAKRVDFESPWGKATALETTSIEADKWAYREGYDLVVLVQPEKGFRQFRAKSDSSVDLSEAKEKLNSLDPGAEWYLHQSKKMLICGHEMAPGTKLSRLSLEEMIKVVKKD